MEVKKKANDKDKDNELMFVVVRMFNTLKDAKGIEFTLLY